MASAQGGVIAMIYVALPTGDGFGGGILGDNLAGALADLVPVQRVLAPYASALPGALLQSVNGDFQPHYPVFSASRRVGYVIFENDLVARRSAVNYLQTFDVIATASRWCEDALRQGGIEQVTTVLHGLDIVRFNPQRAVRRRFLDKFVIFSGGKLEFRKGQDIAVRAFKVFAERHSDALLLAAWHNMQPATHRSMAVSPYWPFPGPHVGERFSDALKRWLDMTGLDPRRVELVPRLPNEQMAAIYGDSDVGLFPNRCEAATNLVLMEYMACGRAAVCTDFSGHRDIITNANSFPLRAWQPLLIFDANRNAIACWCEPSVDEIVDRLEQAYADRSRLALLGQRAAADASRLTWGRTAAQFLELLSPRTMPLQD